MQTIDTETSAEPQATSPRSDHGAEISLLDLLIVLVRRKRFIVASTLLFGVVTAIISLLLPSQYTATTVILPPQNSSAGSALLSELNTMGPMASLAGGLGVKNSNDLYVAMFKSRTVEDAMLQRFNLQGEYKAKRKSDARKKFEGQSEILNNPKDGLIHISVTDRDPMRAAELANGYVEEYRKFSGTMAITEASQRRLFFEQQLIQAKDSLATAEEALKKTEQTTGMMHVESQASALIQSAAALRAQIAAKEVEIHAMRTFASDQNPDLRMAEQELSGWQAQLSRLTGNQSGSENDLLLSKGQVPQAGLEYVRKERDVKYYETIFELLAKQFEMAKLDEAKQGSLVQVVDPAISPDRRSSPRRTSMVLIATIIGFFLAIFWVLAVNVLGEMTKNSEDKNRIELLRTMLFKTSVTGSR